MRSGSRPRGALIAAVAVACLAIALVLARGASHERASGRPVTEPAQSGPEHLGTASTASVTTASEETAVAAALDLAAAPQAWMYLSDADLEAAVRAIAAPASADRLVREIVGDVRVARDALARSPGRVWWIVRPLAWKVESFASDRAQIAVWTVSVLSAADVALPQSDWATTTLDLSWDGATWRLVATRDTPGPSPQLGGSDSAWQPGPFDEALDGFRRVGAEPAS